MLSKKRNEIHNGKFCLIPLRGEMFKSREVVSFDCGDDDLNEFFRIDAYDHQAQLLTTTYYFQPTEVTEKNLFFPVAFVSLLNDIIAVTSDERKGTKKHFYKCLKKKEGIPHPKRNYPSFPAVKIGRLGVSSGFQGEDIGTTLLNMVKELFLIENRTGCRYLTVDAYNNEKTMNFYEKNEFEPLWDEDKEKAQRILYYDLKRFSPPQKNSIDSIKKED